ncbi:MAG TPA: hypothetical protein VLE73_04530 [Candidatus Saccharimonadales bacterium]|nr:hypothetical protein [Candidatus Saccharimonadales bacterium]
MSELTDSIAEAIRKRVVSAALGTYFFFWAAFHWQGIYTTLFTGEDKIYDKFGLLKNEYVNTYFFGWHGWSSVPAYLLPLLLTIVFIWPVPKYVLIHAYRQEQRHKVDKRRVKIEEEEKIEIKKERLALQAQRTLEAEINTAKKEQQAAKQDPRIVWQKEYNAFAKNGLVHFLGEIAESVYKHGGRVTTYYDKDLGRRVGIDLPKDGIAVAHTNDLVQVEGERIGLTEKGKFFLGQSYLGNSSN